MYLIIVYRLSFLDFLYQYIQYLDNNNEDLFSNEILIEMLGRILGPVGKLVGTCEIDTAVSN